MIQVLVTGAGGLVGYDVVKALTDKSEYRVYAAVHHHKTGDWQNEVSIDLENTSTENLGIAFDCIVHCAARIPGSVYSDKQVAAANRKIDDNIIAYCSEHGCRLIYISTAAVYGYEENVLLTERTELKLDSEYKTEKRNSEKKIEDMCNEYCILRISSPYGPRQKNMAVLKKFMDAVFDGTDLCYFGKGERTQNFIDVRDIAQAVVKCIACKEKGIFNIASANPVSMKNLAYLIAATGRNILHTDSKVYAGNNEDAQENVRVNIDISLAQKVIGWRPQIELEDGICDWMNDMKKDCNHDGNYHIGYIPFYYTALSTPHNPEELPDKLEFELTQDSNGIIRQAPSEKVEKYLTLAYQKGSQISGLMDDTGIGKLYADDFLSFMCKHEETFADKKVLEIGCGTGYLLYELQKLGAQVLGVEPGAHGLEGKKKYGIPVINEFFDAEKIKEKFDFVIFYAVLEHMQNAGEFLQDVKSVLKDNGKIFLSVPDCEPYLHAGDISLLLHEHWNYFTKETLETFVRENGLEGGATCSKFAGALYAYLENTDTVQRNAECIQKNILSDYIRKIEVRKEKLFRYIESAMENHTLGIYVPGRMINILSVCYTEIPERIRFFDDNENLYGTYFPGTCIAIENFSDFIKNPVDVMIIASFTFGNKIKQKISESGIECKAVLLEELLDENSSIV